MLLTKYVVIYLQFRHADVSNISCLNLSKLTISTDIAHKVAFACVNVIISLLLTIVSPIDVDIRPRLARRIKGWIVILKECQLCGAHMY